MADANLIIQLRVTAMCYACFTCGISKCAAASWKTTPDCKSDTKDLCAARIGVGLRPPREKARQNPPRLVETQKGQHQGDVRRRRQGKRDASREFLGVVIGQSRLQIKVGLRPNNRTQSRVLDNVFAFR